ncbi:hypothetical protein ABIE78_002317 [Sinorhizobium fredii]
MTKSTREEENFDWLEAELADTLDEDYELELSEPADASRSPAGSCPYKEKLVEPFHAAYSSRARLDHGLYRRGRHIPAASADDALPAPGRLALCTIISASRTMAVRSSLVRTAIARLAERRCYIAGRKDMRVVAHGSWFRILLAPPSTLHAHGIHHCIDHACPGRVHRLAA